MIHDTWYMIHDTWWYILLNIFNLHADVDSRSMTPSRNTRSYTLRSVPSSPGRSFLAPKELYTWYCPMTIQQQHPLFEHTPVLTNNLSINAMMTLVTMIIGPRYTWGPIYGSECLKLSERGFWNWTYVTLADEDTNSILTDNANRAIQDNVAMQITQSGCQLWN